MGLNTTHGCFDGAYSAFFRWRKEIAKAAGYSVQPVKYDDRMEVETVMLDWGHLPKNSSFGEWPSPPLDRLLPLLCHSDCEGVIHPPEAGPIADALEELLPKLVGNNQGGHVGDMVEATKKFIDGLRLAVSLGEDVEFH